MTGNDILKISASLLGYTDANGEMEGLKTIINRGCEFINQIGFDLEIPKISMLSEKLTLSQKAEELLIYGVCMLIALNCEDTDKSELFTRLYNMKRAGFKSNITTKQNVLPFNNGGE